MKIDDKKTKSLEEKILDKNNISDVNIKINGNTTQTKFGKNQSGMINLYMRIKTNKFTHF